MLSKDKILKEIEVDRDYIDHFVMETTQGTKKVKKKFHNRAILERNNYIQQQLQLFRIYQKDLYLLLQNRAVRITPSSLESDIKKTESEFYTSKILFMTCNDDLHLYYKLGFAPIFYHLKEGVSLDILNQELSLFIDKLKEMGITLDSHDFMYSMFSYAYMTAYFDKGRDMREVFDDIYFKCPDIIHHLELNLYTILVEHKKELENYMDSKKEQLLQKYNK